MKIHISSKLTNSFEIPNDKLFKIFTAVPKWNFSENVSGNKGTLFSQLCGSPLDIMYTMEGEMLKIWNSQLSYYVNTGVFFYKSYKPDFRAVL